MKYSFFAQLSVSFEIDDADFALLIEEAKNHYDTTVRMSTQLGGFLYGLKGRREFSDGSDKTMDLTFRQIDLLLKACEPSDTDAVYDLRSKLLKVLDALQAKSIEVNNLLEATSKSIA